MPGSLGAQQHQFLARFGVPAHRCDHCARHGRGRTQRVGDEPQRLARPGHHHHPEIQVEDRLQHQQPERLGVEGDLVGDRAGAEQAEGEPRRPAGGLRERRVERQAELGDARGAGNLGRRAHEWQAQLGLGGDAVVVDDGARCQRDVLLDRLGSPTPDRARARSPTRRAGRAAGRDRPRCSPAVDVPEHRGWVVEQGAESIETDRLAHVLGGERRRVAGHVDQLEHPDQHCRLVERLVALGQPADREWSNNRRGNASAIPDAVRNAASSRSASTSRTSWMSSASTATAATNRA